MNIKVVLFPNSHTEHDDKYQAKIKASIKGTLKAIRRFLKAGEKLTIKTFVKLAINPQESRWCIYVSPNKNYGFSENFKCF